MDISKQPSVNIGVVGDVANGKTTFVESMSTKDTRQYSKEQEGNHTIKLGYANTKIFKCDSCPPPSCYTSTKSSVMSINCDICDSEMYLKRHISFVDCPGHHAFIKTMLNGTSVMDTAILIESASNKTMPMKQTQEHLAALAVSGIQCNIACMNKLDVVKKDDAMKQINRLSKYLSDMLDNEVHIVPIIATNGINTDVVCEYIDKYISDPVHDDDKNGSMIVIRSFNVNQQNIPPRELRGAVIGGSIKEGTFKIGDPLSILPGYKSSAGYIPLHGHVTNIKSEENTLTSAYPGGLIALETSIDPSFATQDGLVGQVAVHTDDIDNYDIYTTVNVRYTTIKIDDDRKHKFETDETLIMHHNANNMRVRLVAIDKKKKSLRLALTTGAFCASLNDPLTLSTEINRVERIIAMGTISSGVYL